MVVESDMETKVTLSIDFGDKNIGIALVRNQEGTNIPLFASQAGCGIYWATGMWSIIEILLGANHKKAIC